MNTQNVNTAAQEPSERCGVSQSVICQKDMPVLLKECLYVLNEVTNRRLPRGSLYPNTYALASAIEAVLLAVAQQQPAVIHRDQQEALSREAQARK